MYYIHHLKIITKSGHMIPSPPPVDPLFPCPCPSYTLQLQRLKLVTVPQWQRHAVVQIASGWKKCQTSSPAGRNVACGDVLFSSTVEKPVKQGIDQTQD